MKCNPLSRCIMFLSLLVFDEIILILPYYRSAPSLDFPAKTVPTLQLPIESEEALLRLCSYQPTTHSKGIVSTYLPNTLRTPNFLKQYHQAKSDLKSAVRWTQWSNCLALYATSIMRLKKMRLGTMILAA